MIARRALAAAMVLAVAAPAAAQPRRPGAGQPGGGPRPTTGQPATPATAALPASTVVALIPLSALGGASPARGAGKLEAALAGELAALGLTVVAPAAVAAKIKAARQPALRACEGDDGCLADVGALVGAQAVVAGEVGGLGDVQVVYLELVDVAARQELRRTQAPLTAGPVEQRAAVIRLVDPARHVGRLEVTTAVDGAAVYVDGRHLGRTPLAPVTLPVGPHALRVTHPEARDFVRFIDVDFERTTSVEADLQPYTAIDREVAATGPTAATVRGAPRDPAWYRRWWAIAGFSAVVLGGAIIAGTALASDTPADASGTVTPP